MRGRLLLIAIMVVLASAAAPAEARGGVIIGIGKTLLRGLSKIPTLLEEALPGGKPISERLSELSELAEQLEQPAPLLGGGQLAEQPAPLLGGQLAEQPAPLLGGQLAEQLEFPAPLLGGDQLTADELTVDGTRTLDHLELSQPPGINPRAPVAVIPSGTFRIQGVSVQSGLIVGRQADIDALLNAGIIRGVMRTGAVPGRLHGLPDDRVVIVANNPAQAAELFNRLKSPRVQTIVHPYSNGEATISATCGLCTPTAAIGYGGGHISFAAGCHHGVKIEVSTAGDFKSSLSKGPFSVAVGGKTDSDHQHTAVNDVVLNGPRAGVSASAGCRNSVKTAALEVSATAVGLTVSVPVETAEVDHVPVPTPSVPVETAEVDHVPATSGTSVQAPWIFGSVVVGGIWLWLVFLMVYRMRD